MTHAYEQLLAEGYLQATLGAGTFVCRELPGQLSPAAAIHKTAAGPIVPIRLSRLGQRLTKDFVHPAQHSGSITFSRWSPDMNHFPVLLWRRLLMRAMRTGERTIFDYAREPHGFAGLRREVAAYVSRSRAVHCAPEQILILNGSQQALDLCARLLAEPGSSVGFENPGYLGMRRVFEAYGLRLRPVRVDQEGIVVRELSRGLRMVCVTPSHQFPTGVAMSLPRRLELLQWARHERAVIVEDDYDSEYRYSGQPLPSLQGLANDVPVIYCGSFSKVMFPGLRIGYAVLPSQLTATFARAKWLVDRQTPVLDQIALADFIGEGHLARHIRRMRKLYGQRRQALVEALGEHFGARARVVGDAAGMHMLVRFADGRVAARAAANKVHMVSSREYYIGKPRPNEFLLGFSALAERTIREGVRRLAQ